MKVYTGLLAALVLLFASVATAQEQTSPNNKVLVIAKIKNEDGVTTTVTKMVDVEHADAYVQSIQSDLKGQEINIKTTDVPEGKEIIADKVIIIDRSVEIKENGSFEKKSFYFSSGDGEHGTAKIRHAEKEFMRGQNLANWNNQGTKRAILGIYAEDENDKGLIVTGLTHQSGAAAAGIKEGDIIQTVDGKSIMAVGGLREILTTRKPGEQVTVTYLQDGQNRTTAVVLGESTDWNWAPRTIERDPCQVFIGVYTSNNRNGEGVYVNGVIGDTPAQVSEVQKGDVILEMDGVPVNTHQELLLERNKHKAGDDFTLTILRNGATTEIDARFKVCPTDKPAEKLNEVVEEPVIETPVVDAPTGTSPDALKLEVFQAFPNPTVGLVNMRFQADAVPTQVQITDVTGKVVYQENLNNFDGYYDRQVDLTGTTPGALTVTVRQGKQVFTQTLILITRA